VIGSGAIVAVTMRHLTGDITYGYAAVSPIVPGARLPFLFLSVTTASCVL
jgi:DHA2 family multidrug resistance protein